MRDAAAALLRDGEIIAAAEEERFVRRRHVTALPVHAVKYCLREAGVSIADLHAIAVPWKYWMLRRRAGLALSAMLRSPRLCLVKGRRTLERVEQVVAAVEGDDALAPRAGEHCRRCDYTAYCPALRGDPLPLPVAAPAGQLVLGL